MEWTCEEAEKTMNLEKEFASYLSTKGFHRFIKAWIDKYERLGYLGGKITLDNLNDEEIKSLSGLLGMDLSNRQLKLTYSQFEKKLAMTKYADADIFQTLELWNKTPIFCRKERKIAYEQELLEFKSLLMQEISHLKAYSWLSYYLENDRYVRRYYDYDPNGYHKKLYYVCQALENLPVYENKYELLAIFSQNITKNPHFFDEDLPRDLLLKGIMFLLEITSEMNSSEQISSILYQAGILKDDISNYCHICHITPKKVNKAWQGFYEDYEPWNMNLNNINQIAGYFQTSPILIFENPSVFRSMCDYAKQQSLPIGFVCSNGQINICTYVLLDKLIQSGCHLYYTGDFDPEGLMIADKLKQRYEDKLTLWGYKEEWLNTIKIKQMNISTKRLQLLTQIQTDELKDIASWIKKNQAFGYQEGLLEFYKTHISDIIDNSFDNS